MRGRLDGAQRCTACRALGACGGLTDQSDAVKRRTAFPLDDDLVDACIHPPPTLQGRDNAAIGQAALGGGREVVRAVIVQRFERAGPAGACPARVKGAAECAHGARIGVGGGGASPEEPVKVR